VPDQVFVAVDWEVTVTVTTHTWAIGVPVMEKSLDACEVVVEVTKKAVALPSGAADTEILTPLEGMAEVILTFNGKFGPGAGADVLPMAGVVVTVSLASGVLLLPPHPQMIKETMATGSRAEKNRFMERCIIIQNKDNAKIAIIPVHVIP
jgi:hypothetical protein